METKFTHFDEQGNAVMVDVSEKNPTSRTLAPERGCFRITFLLHKKAAAKPTSLNIDSAGSQQLLFNSYLQSRDTPCRSCPLHVQPRIPLPIRIRTDALPSDHPGIRRSSGFLPVPDSL